MAARGGLVRTVVAVVTLGVIAVAGCTPTPTPDRTPAPTATLDPPPAGVPDGSDYPDGRPLVPVPDVRVDRVVAAPPGRGMDRYTGQPLRWRSCGNRDCATVLVPLDYARPDGSAIRLAVVRKRAEGTSPGTVLLLPGGPGGPGTALLDVLEGTELGRFDLVSWDPRGVGASTRVRCDDELAARYFEADASPTDDTQLAAVVAAARSFGRSCLARSGELLAHVSTAEQTADLDLLRGLLGLTRVDAFGVSYGTGLQALYATTYPQRSGRMVLDSVFDLDGNLQGADLGVERQIRAFAAFCANVRCRLGADQDAVLARIGRLLSDLGTRPLAVGERRLTQQQAVFSITSSLYEREGSWTRLVRALEPATDGNGEPLLTLYDTVSGRDAEGHYPVLASYAAIRCADSADASVAALLRVRAEQAARSPVLGPYAGAELLCTQWPVAPVPHLPTGSASTPVLLVQNTGDNATPLEWAQAVGARFPASRLVTSDQDGHVAYDDSPCVRRWVVGYLATGELPPAGTTCTD